MQRLAYKKLSSASGALVFDNIPNSYKDLYIMIACRSNANAETDIALLNLNDTAADASLGTIQSAGSVVGTNVNISGGYVPAATGAAGIFSNTNVYISEYNASHNKFGTVESGTVQDRSDNTIVLGHFAPRWPVTSAVTKISIVPSVGTQWVAGSVFAVYGIA